MTIQRCVEVITANFKSDREGVFALAWPQGNNDVRMHLAVARALGHCYKRLLGPAKEALDAHWKDAPARHAFEASRTMRFWALASHLLKMDKEAAQRQILEALEDPASLLNARHGSSVS